MDTGQVVLGRYELKRLLAKGGTARVYEATDLRLGREVAVKILFEELSADAAFVERFRREAQAAANLNHPNIVSVYDWGEADGTYFLVMEYVRGRSLSRYLAEKGRLSPEEAAAIGAKVASALYYAHRQGVIHRDVKPGNVLITEDGQVKVTDFGIARAASASDSITQTGVVMGTAQYFSPEQAQGLSTDGRGDIYSLGVVLYEMVAGRPPFQGDSPVSVALKHVKDPVPSLKSLAPGVPEAFERIVMKCLQKDPAARYQSAKDLAEDLEAFRIGKLRAEQVELPEKPRTLPSTQLAPIPEMPPAEGRGRVRIEDRLSRQIRARKRAYLVATLIALLLAAGLVFWGGWNLGWFGAPASLKAPDVVGQPYTTATQILQNNGLNAKVVKVPSVQAVDIVVAQKPPPGAVIKQGSRVLLEVSAGPLSVKVPPLIGLTLDQARQELQASHLSLDAQGVYSPGEPPNIVLSQSPSAGTLVQVGSVVTVTYSSPNAGVTVPNVVGLSLSDAVSALNQAGLSVGNINNEPSPSVPQGSVISQDPSAGTVVNAGTKVNLVVSTGPGENALPRVIGYTQDAAVKLLTSPPYDLVVSVQMVYSCPQDAGLVVGQNPAGGSFVTQGSEVILQVGEAPPSTTTTSSQNNVLYPTTTSSPASTTTTVCP